MFTGIIEEVGIVRSAYPDRVAISATEVIENSKRGDSIAVDGICFTVTGSSHGSFSVDVMPETVRRTNLGSLRPGKAVNLERPLAVGGRVGGHFVQGHVDGRGRVLWVTPRGESLLVRFEAPKDILRYVVEKGFIAVDGVSLTVTGCDATSFEVALVSYTLHNTNLGGRRPGDEVNVEVDVMAKYVERLWGGATSTITMEFLADHEFVVRKI
ncbi:riboflavin synthase [Chloroflexota bacterium]